jgi:hypothetical protein
LLFSRVMPSTVPFRVSAALALFALTFAGCFRSSSTGDDGGDVRSCDCCGTRVTIPADESCRAGACDPYCGVPDLGVPDGGGGTHVCSCCGTDVEVPADRPCELGVCDPYCLHLDCEDRPLDALCDYSHVVAGSPQELPVLFGDPSGEGCFCPELVQCDARVVEEGVLELSTQICTEPGFFCEACNPFVEGTCSLPPLTEGTWKVTMDGVDAFELAVASADVLPEWGRSCDTPANAATDGCGTLWPPRDARADSVCHPAAAYALDRVPIEVTHDCPPCNAPAGPCEVDIFDDVIRVRTTTLEPACDIACPPACFERTDTCLTPELPEGTWRVQVAGLEGYESVIDVGDGTGGGSVTCGPPTVGG